MRGRNAVAGLLACQKEAIAYNRSMTANMPRTMRPFFTIWLGQLVSLIGSGLTGFALSVWIFDQTGRATPFALTVLFANLPRILLSPVAGPLVDRWNRRRVMVAADSGSALVTVMALLLLGSGQLAVWHIYLIASLNALFGAFQEPAYTASVTMLVPRDSLARANGLIQMSQALEMLVTPLLAGVLFTVIGLRGIFAVDFITYFFAIGALLVVPIPQPRRTDSGEEAGGNRLWQEAVFGWRYLRLRPGLFGLLLYFALVNFFLNFAMVLSGPLVLSFGTASTLGTVQAVGGVGMLAGSLLVSAWGGPKGRIRGLITTIMLGALGVFMAGTVRSALVVGAGFFLLLFNVAIGSTLSQAIFQSKVAPAVQGRVFATRTMISRSIMPLAFLLAGPLADRVFEPLLREGGTLAGTAVGAFLGSGPGRGIGLLFMLSGLILLCVSVAAAAYPRIRNLEAELPDAVVEPEPAFREEPVPATPA